MIPLAGRRIQDLLAELITAKQIEVASLGSHFNRLYRFADGSCFVCIHEEKFSVVGSLVNAYRIAFSIGLISYRIHCIVVTSVFETFEIVCRIGND